MKNAAIEELKMELKNKTGKEELNRNEREPLCALNDYDIFKESYDSVSANIYLIITYIENR